MVYCAVSGCKNRGCNKMLTCRDKTNTTECEDVKFFYFPTNAVLREIWLSRCGTVDSGLKNLCICSQHFKPNDFDLKYLKYKHEKEVLKKDAIPSQHLPNSKNKIISKGSENVEDQQTVVHLSPQGLELKRLTMAANCCIVGCPTVVNGHNLTRLFRFPGKDTAEFKRWIGACKNSAQHIRRLKNPLICPLHFNLQVLSSGKLYPSDAPFRNLTAEEIQVYKKEIGSINQLVAEWMILAQRNNPEVVINGNLLKAKAKEVAKILKMNHFDVDLGWLHDFELYLYLNGIKHWRKRSRDSSKAVMEKIDDENVAKNCCQDLVANEESTLDLDSEQSIKTYREALEKAKLLEEYVKGTGNQNAIELVTLMKNILENTLE